MNRTIIDRYEGDTLHIAGALKTYSTIAAGQWVGATAELIMLNAQTRAPVADVGGVLAIDVGPNPKRFTLTGATMPPVGSYCFRVRVTFADESTLTFPNGDRWNVLRVIKGG